MDCPAMLDGFKSLEGLPERLQIISKQIKSRTQHLVQPSISEGTQTQVHFCSVLTNLTKLILTMINLHINASENIVCLSCLLHTFTNTVDLYNTFARPSYYRDPLSLC